MAPSAEPAVREAGHDDVAAVCRFGEAHIRPHYGPLIGVAAADAQVRRWWNETQIEAAVAGGFAANEPRPLPRRTRECLCRLEPS
jgi:hypothetical protein